MLESEILSLDFAKKTAVISDLLQFLDTELPKFSARFSPVFASIQELQTNQFAQFQAENKKCFDLINKLQENEEVELKDIDQIEILLTKMNAVSEIFLKQRERDQDKINQENARAKKEAKSKIGVFK
ncbi:Hypothetical_protein [Hexamita inflata]|uniref:Hypothetical_protein n=1 Tax=Hexamita inflata TaxID=28002 RepID=A0AA86PEU3_9EUKA|nr:Hypothetical protein HINF_LOCUS24431 [Hexamita inflata]